MKRICLSLILMFTAVTSVAATPSIEDAEKQVSEVIKKFDMAIKNKDKPGFVSLFVDKDVSWIGVLSEQSFNTIKTGMAGLPKEQQRPVRKLSHGSPAAFMDFIVKTKPGTYESFDNVNIDTDGELATVTFDYVFYDGDFKNNWGKESWHLLRTENGWKINSVIFSMTINPKRLVPPAPKPKG